MAGSKSLISSQRQRRLEMALDRVRELLPYDYAQWVVESPHSGDYVVVTARSPLGSECYEIAHRPGVIGQVFRRQQPIFLPEGTAHPLYDSYDPAMTWELAAPLFSKSGLAIVLNLEGQGRPVLDEAAWRRLGALLSSEAGWSPRGPVPTPGEARMLKTTEAKVPLEAALALAQDAANGGQYVLVAGPLNLPASPIYPTLEEALRRRQPIGGCVRGGPQRLDLLVTESAIESSVPWWPVVEGRYDLVLLAVQEM
jgi:hypothetical protein